MHPIEHLVYFLYGQILFLAEKWIFCFKMVIVFGVFILLFNSVLAVFFTFKKQLLSLVMTNAKKAWIRTHFGRVLDKVWHLHWLQIIFGINLRLWLDFFLVKTAHVLTIWCNQSALSANCVSDSYCNHYSIYFYSTAEMKNSNNK